MAASLLALSASAHAQEALSIGSPTGTGNITVNSTTPATFNFGVTTTGAQSGIDLSKLNITANIGNKVTANLVVSVYSGFGGTGTLLATYTVPASSFGSSFSTVAFSIGSPLALPAGAYSVKITCSDATGYTIKPGQLTMTDVNGVALTSGFWVPDSNTTGTASTSLASSTPVLADHSVAGVNTVDFGNFRTGSALSQNFTLTNNAFQTSNNITEALTITSTSLTGVTLGTGTLTAGNAATFLNQGASTTLAVGMSSATAGVRTGSAVVNFGSVKGGSTSTSTGVTAVGNATINVSGTGYRAAAASFSTTTVALGNRRITDTNVTGTTTVTNNVTADGYSEKLKLTDGGTTGAATLGTLPASLTAAGNSVLTVGLSSITAGANSGTVTLGLASDGTGTSGLTELSLGTQAITVTAYGYRAAVAAFDTTTVALGNRRITETNVTGTTNVTNNVTADGYSEKLKLTSGGTTGAATVGSMPSLIAAGANSNVTVGLSSISIGSNSATVTLNKVSDGTGTSGLTDLSLGTQAINVTATGYRAAAASFAATSLDLGVRRTTETNLTGTVNVSNTASNDGYSEKLKLTSGGTTGAATLGTLPASIAAAGNANVTVGLSSIAAGSNSATVTLNKVSDGTGTSGLADLSQGTQAITVTATGYRAAAASFDTTTVALGNRRITETNVTGTTTVTNNVTADGYSEKLKLTSGGTTGAATLGSLPASIIAGGNSALTVGLSSITAGSNSATVTLNKVSDGTGTSGLADLSLGSQAINVTATGYRAAAASFSATTIDLGRIRITDTQSDASGTISVSNTTIASAYSEKLKLLVSSSDGATVTLPGLISAGSSTNVAFSLAEVTLGNTNTHHIVLGLVSDGTGTSGLADLDIGSQEITVTATGVRAAKAVLNKTLVNLGNVRITDTNVTGVVRLTNDIAANADSETLKVSHQGSTGAATVGSLSAVTAGAGRNISVGLSSVSAGANSGKVTLGFASDGSASGFSDLDLGTQDVTVTATGYRAAAASFDKTTIDLGKHHVGATNVAGTATISNNVTADGYSEKLSITNGGVTGSATVGTLPGLISAAGNSGLALGLSSVSAGANSAKATLALASSGTGTSGLADLSLGSQDITILATGYTGQAAWNKTTGGVWASFDNWDGTGGKPGVDGELSTNDTATFGNGLSASATIDLDGAAPVLTALTFDNASAGYTIAKGSGGSLTLGTAQHAATVTNLAGSHTVSADVTLSRNTGFSTAAGTSLVLSGALNGSSRLVKSGSGLLDLTGGGNLTGDTSVEGGLLKVNSDLSGSAVTVQSGGSLGGSGTVGTTVIQSGGTLTPGNSPGDLAITGDMTWIAGGSYNWQLHDATGVVGTGWDVTTISGNLDLGSLSAANPFDINLWTLSGVHDGPNNTDTNGLALHFDNTQSYTWTIARVGGSIVGFSQALFSINLTANNGTSGFANDLGGGSIAIVQHGQNLDLVFTAASQPIPEPSTYGLVLGGLALALAAARRRRS